MGLADAVRDWLERNSPAARAVKQEQTETDIAKARAAAARAEVVRRLGAEFQQVDAHFRGRS